MFANPYYQEYLRKKEEAWEALCTRCGACCGAHDDPCRHLARQADGKYVCAIYASRLGIQESVSGRKFKCVHINRILDQNWFGDRECAYKRILKTPWIDPGKQD
jgi:uncharacterized cysteine cluster protein YcgN (CxxCxxCC family)